MYVADMTLADARAILKEYQASFPKPNEQERWDMEDLKGRIRELS
jgi:hypothetical protein